MTFRQMNSLADEMTKTSPQITRPMPSPADLKATLLGIPRELRNKVFEYVYGEPDAAGGLIKLKVLGPFWAAGTSAGPNLAIDASVRIAPSSAPPSKNAILACRQLRIEMSNMQAAAFRRYWSESTFDIYDDRRLLSKVFYAGSDRDLQYVKRFVDRYKYKGEMITARLQFQAGQWIASFCLPDHAWSTILQKLDKTAPRGFQLLAGFEQAMRAHPTLGAFSGQRANMDPESGLGFTAKDLHAAKVVFRALIRDWVRSLF